MNLKSFSILLSRQLRQKWGRFLMASGGIMIGVWAITLTSSLSFGLSNTIVQAINSQPLAKFVQVYKTPDGTTDIFGGNGIPKFIALSRQEITDLKTKFPDIVGVSPSELANFRLRLNQEYQCVNQVSQINILSLSQLEGKLDPVEAEKQIKAKQKEVKDNCAQLTFASDIFQRFYDTNRANWLGKTEQPGRFEIALCFKCGQMNLGKEMGFASPEAMLNQEITLEPEQAPDAQKVGAVFDLLANARTPAKITKSYPTTFKIVAVIDDRQAAGSFGNNGASNAYIDFTHFEDAIKLANPSINLNEVGYLENNLYLNSYENLDKVIDQLKGAGYMTVSIGQILVGAVKTVFSILTIILGLFGLIALVASMFGIINVMTISVLERKKEIGILKSLGARNTDIFWIFLIESSFLGFLGWLMGTLLSVTMGYLISFTFKSMVNGNDSWKNSLRTLNIDGFNPAFPLSLLLGTFALALFFTVVSGIFPALKASRQNPVDVLRSE